MKRVIHSMRLRNVEAKQARMLHPDYFNGKDVKDKARNE